MADERGPITLITNISDQRNRWKVLAYAWKTVALEAVESCAECGGPALWGNPKTNRFWCEEHWKMVASQEPDAEKLPWYVALLKAMDLEDAL